jgi:hypothetical protein
MTHEQFVRAYREGKVRLRIRMHSALHAWLRCGGDRHMLPERRMWGWPRSIPIWAAFALIGIGSLLDAPCWRHSWVPPLIELLAFLGVVAWAFFVSRGTVIYLLMFGGMLCIPTGCFWVPLYGRSEWVGWTIVGAGMLAVLAATLLLRRATLRFLREEALADERFYDLALASAALKVTWPGRPPP